VDVGQQWSRGGVGQWAAWAIAMSYGRWKAWAGMRLWLADVVDRCGWPIWLVVWAGVVGRCSWPDMYGHTCVDMCIDMCMDIGVDMCVDTCIDMCIDTCQDM
jgi:hypothetical protein